VNWFLVLVLLYFKAVRAPSLEIVVVTYSAVFIYNTIFTIWPGQIESLLRRRPYLIVVDCLFCVSLIFAYGWGSPFYVYSFSPVMLAGYLFNLPGGFAAAAIGAIGYQLSIAINGKIWADIVRMGEIDTHLFQMFDYFLVAIFFSYPAVLAESLRRANEELRNTQAKIERLVLAQERQRIAEDMHDNVTQSLLGVNLLLDASMAKNQNDPKLNRELSLAKEAAVKAMGDMREAVDDLFKERLDRLTASEIVEQVLSKACETHDLDASLNTSGKERELSADTKKALYLIIQESITNILKHAKATAVAIGMVFTPEGLQLEISDNGCGFDYEAKKAGNGLDTVSRRLMKLKGTIEISSSPEAGTRIVIRLPLSGAKNL
jgi:signal transduction histidine kinase